MLRVVAACRSFSGGDAILHDGSAAFRLNSEGLGFKLGEQLGVSQEMWKLSLSFGLPVC